MLTKEEEAKILAIINSQNKYSSKEELLIAIRDYLTQNLFKEDNSNLKKR